MEEILQKAASEFTKQRQIDFLKEECLDWNNRDDFDNAEKGFIGKDSPAIIYDDAGMAVQDMELYHRILHEVDECPDTVNPSLWRHSLLNDYVGLFKVTEKVYQVRGYDLSNLTVVVGETGYIILDTLLKVETAKAAMKLIYKLLGEKPIKAIVIGHSHTDHFGGVLGVLETRVNLDEQIPIIVPEYFEEAALGENVLAGIAMTRRGAYQFGFTLPTGHTGVIDSGLGKRGPRGTTSFVFATDYIRKTGEKRIIDGVEMIFQMAPESEAPASMHIYLDTEKLLWVGEVVNQTNHNLCPMRGAPTRDAKKWAKYIDEMIELFENVDILAGSHFWPVWGRDKVLNMLKKQRDLYQFTHDQTLRMINMGYTAVEIANELKLPKELATEWFNRDYYGNFKFNVRSVYTKYLGWYDGNPVNLDLLSPVETAKRTVSAMGGVDNVIKMAKDSFDKGEYQWVLQLLNNAVFAEPENDKARLLMADACEQLGYIQEAATWRNAYLTGAAELRSKAPKGFVKKTLEMYTNMSEKDLFEYLAVRLNGKKAEGFNISIEWEITDRKSRYISEIYNSVMHNIRDKKMEHVDVHITLDSTIFIKIMLLDENIDDYIKSGEVSVEGNLAKFKDFLTKLEVFKGNFNIMLP